MQNLLCSILVSVTFIFSSFCNDFSQIDAFASQLPSHYKSSKELADAINDSVFSDVQKLRALYVWIAENVKYDVKAFESGLRPRPLPSNTLKKKKAVCYGYAVLFDSVCYHLNIPSYVVLGYTRNGFNPRSSDHSWNVVNINDEWKFIDQTWGSGKIEKVEKQGIFNKILKKPQLKSTSVYIQELNNDFFLADAEEMLKTHLPSDPMWQLKNYPYNINCFLSGYVSCNIDSVFFDFSDTINQFQHLKYHEQLLSSGKRANDFNSMNCFDLAFAHLSEGIKLYNYSESIVPESVSYLKKVLENASSNLQKGQEYLEKGRQVDDSIYRSRSAELKQNYRKHSRAIKTYYRGFYKFNSKNIKYSEKIKSENKKLNTSAAQYRERAANFIYDEKIYLIERPQELPTYSDSVIFVKEKQDVDSIFLLVNHKYEEIENILNHDIKEYYDTIKMYREKIPGELKIFNTRINQLNKVLAENHYNTFQITDTLFQLLEKEYIDLESYHNEITRISGGSLKMVYREIKNMTRVVETEGKKIRSKLITIKKNSLLNQGEEDKYEEINQIVNKMYLSCSDQINNFSDFIDKEKENIKDEKKWLKQSIRTFGNTSELLTAYYDDTSSKMKTRYNNEKNIVKQLNKTASSAGNVCLKALKE